MHNEPLKGSDRIAGAVLKRIKDECISPRPRWHFLMRESVIWSLGIISIAVGSVSVAGILFELRFASWDLYLATHESFLHFVLDSLPFVWVGLFTLFGIAVYQSIRYTKRGYRYSPAILIVGSFAASCAVGAIILTVGAGRYIDEQIGRFMPLHQPLFERERMLWSSTERGRVSGVVTEIPFGNAVMRVEGPNEIRYRIDMDGFEPTERAAIRVGDHVRILGVPTSTPDAMSGCAIFIRPDDVLVRVHTFKDLPPALIEELSTIEKKILFARTTGCKDVRPFTRILPKQSNGY